MNLIKHLLRLREEQNSVHEEEFVDKMIRRGASTLCKLKGGHIPFTGVSRNGMLQCKRCDAWYADDLTAARAKCEKEGHVKLDGFAQIEDGQRRYKCTRCKSLYKPKMNEAVDMDDAPDSSTFQTRVRPAVEKVIGDESFWLDVDVGDKHPGLDGFHASNALESLDRGSDLHDPHAPSFDIGFSDFVDARVIHHPGSIDIVGEDGSFRGSYKKLLMDGRESIFADYAYYEYGGPGAQTEFLVRKSDIDLFIKLGEKYKEWLPIAKRRGHERFLNDLQDDERS